MEDQTRRNPPKLIDRFLEWFCDDQYLEDLQGDLYEYHHRRVRKYGRVWADLGFFLDVLRNCKLYLFRWEREGSVSRFSIMLFHLKTIKRILVKDKFYAAINIAGLALGISSSLFIWKYVNYELSFEDFHTKADDIYRITMNFYNRGSGSVHWARTPDDWIIDVIDELPEVRSYIRFQNYYPRIVKVGEKIFKEEYAFSTDSSVFTVFDFKLIKGDPGSALKNPFSVVLTESLAEKFFGHQDPMGQYMEIHDVHEGGEGKNFLVTGVMADVPSNTHLPVNLLTSFNNKEHRSGWSYSYLHMEKGTVPDEVEKKFPALVDKYAEGDSASQYVSLHLHPLRDLHLHSHLAREILPPGDVFYLRIFGVAGVFILLMAVINFTNLSTSRSLGRVREIGVRKVLGSNRNQLFWYFLFESLAFASLASLLAVGMVITFEPWFFNFTGIAILFDLELIAFLLTVTLLTGMLGGLYPALMISSFRPVTALKKHGLNKTSENSVTIRQVLLGIQFTISLIIISSAMITWKQFDFLSNKDLGFDKEQVLAITNSPLSAQAKYEEFKNEVIKIPGILAVTANMEVPSREIRDTGAISFDGQADEGELIIMDVQIVDSNYVDFMKMKLLAGRNFNPYMRGKDRPPTDASTEATYEFVNTLPREYIINQTAMKLIGAEQASDVIGRRFGWSNGTLSFKEGKIIGVLKDSHQETLYNKVDPLVMIHEPVFFRTFLIKLETANLSHTLTNIEEVWKSMFPDFPLESTFLDDLFDQLYASERRQKEILSVFSTAAIFIATLGLLGLISFMLQRRMKELAIRKILGASLFSIIQLFGKGFVVQALVGLALAVPVTFYLMQEWLDNFAYRTSISGIEFLLSFLILLGVLVITTILQVGWSAHLNPAETLRDE